MNNSVKIKSQIQDRRKGEDRRSLESPGILPVINIKGKIIKHDRRRTPDRRIANIQVEEIYSDIENEIFY